MLLIHSQRNSLMNGFMLYSNIQSFLGCLDLRLFGLCSSPHRRVNNISFLTCSPSLSVDTLVRPTSPWIRPRVCQVDSMFVEEATSANWGLCFPFDMPSLTCRTAIRLRLPTHPSTCLPPHCRQLQPFSTIIKQINTFFRTTKPCNEITEFAMDTGAGEKITFDVDLCPAIQRQKLLSTS